MPYLEAPNHNEDLFKDRISIFLGGGISNCPDWQKEFTERFLSYHPEILLINPRRSGVTFAIDDPIQADVQIKWEHEYLKRADYILFWYPCETLCPITLWENGYWLAKNTKHLFMGHHPEYKRKLDLQIQTQLANTNIKVVDGFDNFINEVIEYFKK